MVKKYGALSSSADPEKLALTVKGLLVSLIPIVIILANRFGVDLAETDLSYLIEALGGSIAAIMIFMGAVRKIYLRFRSE